MKFFIAAGHGGEVGALGNGTNEHKEVVDVVQKIMKYAPQMPFELVMVPLEYSLEQRIKFVNQSGTQQDYLIEVHMNSSGKSSIHGSEVYYYAGYPEMQYKAQKIAQDYATFCGTYNAGPKADSVVRFGRLGVIRDTKPLAFLIETGYITNVEDLVLVREKAAFAIVQAILGVTGNKYLEEKKIPEQPKQPPLPVDPFQAAIDWSIVTKVSNGERPKETATRQEVMAMIYNYHKFLKKDTQ